MSSRHFNESEVRGQYGGRIPRPPPAGNRRANPTPTPQDDCIDSILSVVQRALQLSVLGHRSMVPLHRESLRLARLRIAELATINFHLESRNRGFPFHIVTGPYDEIDESHQRHPQFPGFFVVPLGRRAFRNAAWGDPQPEEFDIEYEGNLEFPDENSDGDPPSPIRITIGERAAPRPSRRQHLPDLSNLQLGERMLYIRCFIMDLLLPELLQDDLVSLLGHFHGWMSEHPENPDIPIEEDLTTTVGCIYFLISRLEADIPLLEGNDGGDGRGYRLNVGPVDRERRARMDCSIHGRNTRVAILIYLRGIVALFFQYAEVSYMLTLMLERRVMHARMFRGFGTQPDESGTS